jgi:hypothetical protein
MDFNPKYVPNTIKYRGVDILALAQPTRLNLRLNLRINFLINIILPPLRALKTSNPLRKPIGKNLGLGRCRAGKEKLNS